MTLNEWIDNYCEENNIELPDDIADNKTALNFLALNSNSGGGGDTGCVVAIVYLPNSDIGWQIEGDFNAAKEKLSAGKPIYAFYYQDTYASSAGVSFITKEEFMGVEYNASLDRIALALTSSTGYYWTSNGLEYYD